MQLRPAYSDKYIYALPEGHRFPIAKYELIATQLLYQGIVTPEQLYDPGLVSAELACLAHDAHFWQKIEKMSLSAKEVRKIGLPLTEIAVKRARNSTMGTVHATREAVQFGLGINLGGGTHHAYAGHGEGFCLLNDIAVAAAMALDAGLVRQILVIDLDVHQGNGTAHIFREESRVFTFSMHGQGNYPLHKEASDLDIALPRDTGDAPYLEALYQHLPKVLQAVKPDLVYYQSGVDVLATDKLGHLALSMDGLKRRDEFVFTTCLATDIPLVLTMGGGYSELHTVVNAHFSTYKMAIELYA